MRTSYSLEEMREWFDQEGGPLGLMRHGVELAYVPEELLPIWQQFVDAYEAFEAAWDKVTDIMDDPKYA